MINSLRLEKGYRAWGADISPDDTALGSEPIYRNGQVVGYTTSGAYGHTWALQSEWAT